MLVIIDPESWWWINESLSLLSATKSFWALSVQKPYLHYELIDHNTPMNVCKWKERNIFPMGRVPLLMPDSISQSTNRFTRQSTATQPVISLSATQHPLSHSPGRAQPPSDPGSPQLRPWWSRPPRRLASPPALCWGDTLGRLTQVTMAAYYE